MKLLISYGTRPEYIKLVPLMEELEGKIPFKTFYTGQHKDLIPEGIKPDYVLRDPGCMDGGNRLDSIVANILGHSEMFNQAFTHVMVQGDTTSAFAVALGAFHRQIPVIHLEAGLRTYKATPYPEEFNRTAISKMAYIHLCPTKQNLNNLMRDGINTPHMYVTGNTVIDNIKHISPTYGDTVLVTMHRRENHEKLPEYFKVISKLAENNLGLEFIIPLHPNPNVQKHKALLKGVNVVKPMPYDKFIHELASCRMVITDSGGLQEEASHFGKMVIVCRDSTERPETVGTYSYMCRDADHLEKLFESVNLMGEQEFGNSPYGDGQASKKIREILEKL
jgi:UDP-N-acetylglucosamine 2-epimerase (non-hydrolysing)